MEREATSRSRRALSVCRVVGNSRFIEILIEWIKAVARQTNSLSIYLSLSLYIYIFPVCHAFIPVVAQYFEVQVYDQFAIRGNAAIFKCQVPSFVADHVDVVGWIDSNGGSYVADGQSYGIDLKHGERRKRLAKRFALSLVVAVGRSFFDSCDDSWRNGGRGEGGGEKSMDRIESAS